MTTSEREILGLSTSELSALCRELGYPEYRGRQIAHWVYRASVRDFDSMTNLPRELRGRLSEAAVLTRSRVLGESRSDDGTTKLLLGMADKETIECVLLPYPDRVSVCVSTQVGCPAGCVFCATAQGGLVRNLTAGEIVDQVLTLNEIVRPHRRVTHVVFMGMGEPLLNYENVIKALRLLHDELGISMRRMTVSTVGITPAIRNLCKLRLQLTLAVSLHAPYEDLRRKLIPISARYPLSDLISACRDYADHTKRRVTFEYLLLSGVNDSHKHAEALAALLKGVLCHVNLIPYNRVLGKSFSRPSGREVAAFRSVLEQAGIQVTQRLERGHAVSAACGQLRRQRSAGCPPG